MRRIRGRPVLAGVLALTALAIAVRLWGLGWRMAHWDEARVAVNVLEYGRTGVYTYRPVVHGPFLFHVDELLFDLLGPSDFAMRLPVAVVGGLLPATAWLFRERLRDAEVLALAALFAFNPVLLYYSRFMRNDVLLAAFGVAAVGFAVRTVDTGRARYLYAAAASLGLAFTTKENALVYVGCWVGAAALLFDFRLFAAAAGDGSWRSALGDLARSGVARLRVWWPHLVLAGVSWLAVVVFFYAPRPDLWYALSDPGRFSAVVEAGSVGAWEAFYDHWVTGTTTDHDFMSFFTAYVETLRYGALPLVALAALGFVVDRYTGGGPRDVVALMTYWGAVGVLIYPVVSDIPAPWATVHTVAPLAVPAAVGVGLVYRRGRAALDADRRGLAAGAAVVLVLVGGQVAVTGYAASYDHPQDETPLVQYAQPDENMKPMIDRILDVARENEGVDVAFYGVKMATPNYKRPLGWYFDRAGVNYTSWPLESDVLQYPKEELPPVVIAASSDSPVATDNASEIEPYLDGYERYEPVATRLTIPGNQLYLVVFVDRDRVPDRQQRAADADR